MNPHDATETAYRNGYAAGMADARKNGHWIYSVQSRGYDCHVTAKCSECGWDWFSKDGVGNYSSVFGAFIMNYRGREYEAETFLLDNARKNNKFKYCPCCGAKMEGADE